MVNSQARVSGLGLGVDVGSADAGMSSVQPDEPSIALSMSPIAFAIYMRGHRKGVSWDEVSPFAHSILLEIWSTCTLMQPFINQGRCD